MEKYRKKLEINFNSHEDAQEVINFITNNKFDETSDYIKSVRFEIEFTGKFNAGYRFGDGFTDDTAILDLAEGTFDYPEEVIKVGDYVAKISDDGQQVAIGCQTVNFEEVEKLYIKMKKVKENS
jgi:hypothetical protein